MLSSARTSSSSSRPVTSESVGGSRSAGRGRSVRRSANRSAGCCVRGDRRCLSERAPRSERSRWPSLGLPPRRCPVPLLAPSRGGRPPVGSSAMVDSSVLGQDAFCPTVPVLLGLAQSSGSRKRGHPPCWQVAPRGQRVSGGVLLSHPVSRAVPSALKGLASGFGMGPGVSLSPWPPELYGDVAGSRPYLGNRTVDAAKCVGQVLGLLVPVSSTCFQASTSGLSTQSSGWGPYQVNPVGDLILKRASRLDAFSGYLFRT